MRLHFTGWSFSEEPIGLEFAPLLQVYKDKPEVLASAAMAWSITKLGEVLPKPKAQTIYRDDNGHILEWTNPADKEKIALQMAEASTHTKEVLQRVNAGICTKCQKPITGFLKRVNSDKVVKVKLGTYMYLHIHLHSGLCIECIEEFLRSMMSELQQKAKDNVVMPK